MGLPARRVSPSRPPRHGPVEKAPARALRSRRRDYGSLGQTTICHSENTISSSAPTVGTKPILADRVPFAARQKSARHWKINSPQRGSPVQRRESVPAAVWINARAAWRFWSSRTISFTVESDWRTFPKLWTGSRRTSVLNGWCWRTKIWGNNESGLQEFAH